MKKIVFLLSMMMLSACSTNPTAKDPNALPNGMMQPVAGTGAVAGGSFMPEVKQQSMPANMK